MNKPLKITIAALATLLLVGGVTGAVFGISSLAKKRDDVNNNSTKDSSEPEVDNTSNQSDEDEETSSSDPVDLTKVDHSLLDVEKPNNDFTVLDTLDLSVDPFKVYQVDYNVENTELNRVDVFTSLDSLQYTTPSNAVKANVVNNKVDFQEAGLYTFYFTKGSLNATSSIIVNSIDISDSQVTSQLKIDSLPTKVDYFEFDDKLNLSGLTVSLHYYKNSVDFHSEVITGFTVLDLDSHVVNNSTLISNISMFDYNQQYPLTVTYQDYDNVKFNIQKHKVTDLKQSLSLTAPTKNDYQDSDVYSTSGLKVVLNQSYKEKDKLVEKSKVIPATSYTAKINGEDANGYVFSSPNTYTVEVSTVGLRNETISNSYTVNVSLKERLSKEELRVSGLNVTYEYKDSLDMSSLSYWMKKTYNTGRIENDIQVESNLVTAYYKYQSEDEVQIITSTIVFNQSGLYTFRFVYGQIECIQSVTVNVLNVDNVKDRELVISKYPAKLQYYEFDKTLDLTGLEVREIRRYKGEEVYNESITDYVLKDATGNVITNGCDLSSLVGLKADGQSYKLTVIKDGCGQKDFNIKMSQVEDLTESLSLSCNKQYNEGNAFETSSLTVKLTTTYKEGTNLIEERDKLVTSYTATIDGKDANGYVFPKSGEYTIVVKVKGKRVDTDVSKYLTIVVNDTWLDSYTTEISRVVNKRDKGVNYSIEETFLPDDYDVYVKKIYTNYSGSKTREEECKETNSSFEVNDYRYYAKLPPVLIMGLKYWTGKFYEHKDLGEEQNNQYHPTLNVFVSNCSKYSLVLNIYTTYVSWKKCDSSLGTWSIAVTDFSTKCLCDYIGFYNDLTYSNGKALLIYMSYFDEFYNVEEVAGKDTLNNAVQIATGNFDYLFDKFYLIIDDVTKPDGDDVYLNIYVYDSGFLSYSVKYCLCTFRLSYVQGWHCSNMVKFCRVR